MTRRAPAAAILLALLTACGGGGNPTGPGGVPAETYDVVAVLFYDENGNGTLDANEAARIPNATVEVAGRSGRSQPGTGRAVVSGVPGGSATLTVRGLPPFYGAGSPVPLQVPQAAGTELRLPITLPIGDNRPNSYMAFGDSISAGDGSSDGTGYRGPLQASLRAAFGSAEVLNRGAEGTISAEGRERIARGLRALTPAETLTLYGTNDWNETSCRDAFPCDTVDNLREIVRTVKGAHSVPFLATIIPANPDRNPAERNDWVKRMNELIRPMARDEGAVLVDLEAAFLKESDLSSLFSDHVHPNDRGYAIIADEFAKAISQPAASSSSSLDAPLLLEPWRPLPGSRRQPLPPPREYHSRLR